MLGMSAHLVGSGKTPARNDLLHTECDIKVYSLHNTKRLCCTVCRVFVAASIFVLALDPEGVHDVKLHHPSSSVATSNQ